MGGREKRGIENGEHRSDDPVGTPHAFLPPGPAGPHMNSAGGDARGGGRNAWLVGVDLGGLGSPRNILGKRGAVQGRPRTSWHVLGFSRAMTRDRAT